MAEIQHSPWFSGFAFSAPEVVWVTHQHSAISAMSWMLWSSRSGQMSWPRVSNPKQVPWIQWDDDPMGWWFPEFLWDDFWVFFFFNGMFLWDDDFFMGWFLWDGFYGMMISGVFLFLTISYYFWNLEKISILKFQTSFDEFWLIWKKLNRLVHMGHLGLAWMIFDPSLTSKFGFLRLLSGSMDWSWEMLGRWVEKVPKFPWNQGKNM